MALKKISFLSMFGLSFVLSVHLFAEVPPRELWKARYGSVATDGARRLCADGSGNVYVTGYVNNGLNNDLIVIKYNSSGETVWVKNINRGDADEGYDIVLDKTGYLYIAGYSTNTNYDGFLVKMDTDGNTVWQKTFDMSGNPDKFCGIALDSSGNVYLCGYANEGGGGGGKTFIVAKCNSTCDTLDWTFSYPPAGMDEARGIVVSEDGFVYATGVSNNNILTVKLDSSGNSVWTKIYDSGGVDEGNGLVLNREGHILVAGCIHPGANYDYVLIKYNSDSSTVCTKTLDGGADDIAFGVATDQCGYIYVCGRSYGSNNDDYLVVKYNPSGDSIIWKLRYDSGQKDECRDIKLGGTDYLYLAGSSGNLGTEDLLTIKYILLPTPGIRPPVGTGEVKIGSTGGKGIVHQGEQAIISFRPASAGKVIMRIYTLNGMLVWEDEKIVSDPLDSSLNYFLWDCRNRSGDIVVSGTYIVFVEGPGIRVSKKVIIMR